MKKRFIACCICLPLLCVTSCRKFTQVDPPSDVLVSPLPFRDDGTAMATLSGIYSEMMNSRNQFSAGLTTLLAGLSSDELYFYSPGYQQEFAANELTPANHANLDNYFWSPAYRYIYSANLVLEHLSRAEALSEPVKQQLQGEALFVRAFCFFYLTNLFGDVPLPLTSDYRVNERLPRTPAAAVLEQVRQDLESAVALLPAGSTGKIRPGKWAATALLARTHLYAARWQEAVHAATSVMQSGFATLEGNPAHVFGKDSKETVWHLQPVVPNFNTYVGNAVLPANNNTAPSYLVRDNLRHSFATEDLRAAAWIGTRTFGGQTLFYPAKYRVYGGAVNPVTEYYVVLRLAEQYLIRAEAQAHLGKLSEALQDLNTLRSRAGVSEVWAETQEEVLELVAAERQRELFAEWGHRWLDLKRTGKAQTVLAPVKGATWLAADTLWPLPQGQINLNGSLTQNPGY